MNFCGMRATLVSPSTSSTHARPTAKQALVAPRLAALVGNPATSSKATPSDTLADAEPLHGAVETLVCQMFAQTRGIPLRYYGWRVARAMQPPPSTTKNLTDALRLIPDATARGGVSTLSTAGKLLSYPLNAEQLDVVKFSVLPGLKYAAWGTPAEDTHYADVIKQCLVPLKRYGVMRTEICVVERIVANQLDPVTRLAGPAKRPPRYITPAMRLQKSKELNATRKRLIAEAVNSFYNPKVMLD